MASANYSDITGRVIGHWSGGGGGGSIPFKVVSIGYADVLANQLGDGSNAAPLVTAPAGSLITVYGYIVTEAFNDSSVDGADTLQVVDDADQVSISPVGSFDLSAVTPPDTGPFYNFNFGQSQYSAASMGLWLLFRTDWAFDGTTGSVDVLLSIETAA